MPEITEGSEYLVALLHSAGTATATGMGLVGLEWQEIESWVRCADMQGLVTPRDLKIIHMLSRVYANEHALASQKNAKPPYVPKLELEELMEQREFIAQTIDDMFASMMAKQPEKNIDKVEQASRKVREIQRIPAMPVPQPVP